MINFKLLNSRFKEISVSTLLKNYNMYLTKRQTENYFNTVFFSDYVNGNLKIVIEELKLG